MNCPRSCLRPATPPYPESLPGGSHGALHPVGQYRPTFPFTSPWPERSACPSSSQGNTAAGNGAATICEAPANPLQRKTTSFPKTAPLPSGLRYASSTSTSCISPGCSSAWLFPTILHPKRGIHQECRPGNLSQHPALLTKRDQISPKTHSTPTSTRDTCPRHANPPPPTPRSKCQEGSAAMRLPQPPPVGSSQAIFCLIGFCSVFLISPSSSGLFLCLLLELPNSHYLHI